MEDKTVYEALRDARSILAERGHAKGALEDAEGRVCLGGAIWLATTGSAIFEGGNGPPPRVTIDALGTLMGLSPDGDFVSYNNAPERTEAEVLALLDQAAESVKPAESRELVAVP